MKNIYLLISNTGTLPARFISFFTKDRYTHVAIALNAELTEMYTFGRKYTYLPLPGGFICESKERGIYKRFTKTKSALLELSVNEDVYEEIQDKLRTMYLDKNKYKYNLLGIFYAKFGKLRKKENYFYCSEFVQEVFEPYGLGVNTESGVIRPINFLSVSNGKLLFEGVLSNYQAQVS